MPGGGLTYLRQASPKMKQQQKSPALQQGFNLILNHSPAEKYL